jgi:hypothetical protein
MLLSGPERLLFFDVICCQKSSCLARTNAGRSCQLVSFNVADSYKGESDASKLLSLFPLVCCLISTDYFDLLLGLTP